MPDFIEKTLEERMLALEEAEKDFDDLELSQLVEDAAGHFDNLGEALKKAEERVRDLEEDDDDDDDDQDDDDDSVDDEDEDDE